MYFAPPRWSVVPLALFAESDWCKTKEVSLHVNVPKLGRWVYVSGAIIQTLVHDQAYLAFSDKIPPVINTWERCSIFALLIISLAPLTAHAHTMFEVAHWHAQNARKLAVGGGSDLLDGTGDQGRD